MIARSLAPTPAHRRGASNVSSNDPFLGLLRPPSNETPVQRQIRLREEVVARKRSEQIDKHLKEEVARIKKERVNERTVLLLGEGGDREC